ncbi:hypothetical protein DFJ58DRAFT_696427 [Suillus subalutaceus]|uniref:uncharacterized protein n=1 Tax=Suillus subalutaceus TaxID=48586 RepID=UPI001B861447|nr:uncharacterized protein DFJ58DRAFT_696427 [Suillus subalutaceus]KAG1872334.1 hypothetical protein DFJ58DRAFT_696427 [Suillus subalutaceus]
MYYIAGLTNTALPSSAQTVEGLAVFTAFRYLQYIISGIRAIAPVANAESGNIRTTPTSFIGKIIYLIHDIPFLIPPVTYILCVPFNRLVQPAWMQRMSLPNTYFKHESQVGLRVAACAATFVLLRFTGRTLTHLGNQWHPIGRREKPRVVQTGPYAVVRHPLYMSLLIQELLFTLMSWSYAPLVGLGIVAGAFAVKMPIEEDLIMQDPAIAAEYRAYMRRVPSRVIPFLW